LLDSLLQEIKDEEVYNSEFPETICVCSKSNYHKIKKFRLWLADRTL